jgi:hypothetical protein
MFRSARKRLSTIRFRYHRPDRLQGDCTRSPERIATCTFSHASMMQDQHDARLSVNYGAVATNTALSGAG